MTDTPIGPIIDPAVQYTAKMFQTVTYGPAILLKGSEPLVLGAALTEILADNPGAVASYMAV